MESHCSILLTYSSKRGLFLNQTNERAHKMAPQSSFRIVQVSRSPPRAQNVFE